MSTRIGVALALVSLSLAVIAMTAWPAFPQDKPRPAPAVEITLRLDKAEATPEETVHLEELIPSSKDVKVTAVHHQIVRLARYDPQRRALVTVADSAVLLGLQHDEGFVGLAGAHAASHPMRFEIQTPRQKGFEFVFRPQRLGIFLITAEWLVSGDENWIASQPVVLIVRPPLDDKGKPIVKPEWLREKAGIGEVEITDVKKNP